MVTTRSPPTSRPAPPLPFLEGTRLLPRSPLTPPGFLSPAPVRVAVPSRSSGRGRPLPVPQEAARPRPGDGTAAHTLVPRTRRCRRTCRLESTGSPRTGAAGGSWFLCSPPWARCRVSRTPQGAAPESDTLHPTHGRGTQAAGTNSGLPHRAPLAATDHEASRWPPSGTGSPSPGPTETSGSLPWGPMSKHRGHVNSRF